MKFYDYLTQALLSQVTSEHWLGLEISTVFNIHCVTEGALQDPVCDSYRNIRSLALQQKIPF